MDICLKEQRTSLVIIAHSLFNVPNELVDLAFWKPKTAGKLGDPRAIKVVVVFPFFRKLCGEV